MKKLLVLLFGGWMCEIGHYHLQWEKDSCSCWVENTVWIHGILERRFK